MLRALLLVCLFCCGCHASGGVFTNPVIANEDTPDPGVAFDVVSGRYWAGTTTGDDPTGSYRLHSSADLGTWRDEGFIFPAGQRPAWIESDCWAPELHMIGGRWVAVFVGRAASSGLLSIGVATTAVGATPAGPWTDSGAPLIMDSGANAQGQIDPTIFVGDGAGPLLVFKEDGNFDGRPTPFHYARLAANGTALAPGEASAWKGRSLLEATLPWEGALVEAPWITSFNGSYFLFYSGNGFGSDYAVGVARAESLLGPYVKHGEPICAQNAIFNNPGHCSVVDTGNGVFAMVYHAYLGADRSARHMMLDAIQWSWTEAEGLWPFVAGGSPSSGGFLPP